MAIDKNKEQEDIYANDDQAFGDNNHVAPISDEALAEREESFRKNPAKHDNYAGNEEVREKLNEKLNEVRNYGEDAREVPL